MLKPILLVEDNEMNRDMLSRRLARRGHDVAIAVDGLEGVALFFGIQAAVDLDRADAQFLELFQLVLHQRDQR